MSRQPRPAARILLIDPAGRVLMFRFTAHDRPPFWCPPGGALESGESYPAAARRELLEETGIDADPGEEVARKLVDFTTIEGVAVSADERYFVVRSATDRIDTGGHTALEQRVMRSWRWFTADDLARHDEIFYPDDLAELVASHAEISA
ncbi:NUDIX domain-containing protein [Sphingomonas sp.]|uniref:NUDIX hydrolase n=1 Tax=Sphingomonas sp. TaxID=28214 RepID=UPI001D8AEDC9|nr:NUDIX domain-containing protein [Sphingomonas sp.]MBX9797150.1 NUDIX domain-containing protein [Sphingomonas sp.]